VLHTAEGLTRLIDQLAAAPSSNRPPDLATVEATALHTVTTLLATSALARTESRGCHRRSDAPETGPEWQVRLVHRLDRDGRVHTRQQPVRALAGVPA
jgi:L-aspartate oxidase